MHSGASSPTSRVVRLLEGAWLRLLGRLPLPAPGTSVFWWKTFTGDSHYYQVDAALDADPHAHEDMPWTLELSRDRQFYERKYCPSADAALDLQAAWKRMVRQRGLGRVYWTGSASMGRYDILIVDREGQWRLLLYVKDRHAETRTFPTEEGAVAAGQALESDLRNRPWFPWEPTAGGASQRPAATPPPRREGGHG